MCTVTLVPLRHGYRLGMNRDEQRSRPAGCPPAVRRLARGQVLGPFEPDGGTWISVNQAGIAYALINWYAVPTRPHAHPVSRGTIIPNLFAASVSTPATAVLKALPLDRIRPFRLIAVDPSRHAIAEWRWDQRELTRGSHPWAANTWISSGHDEPGAQRHRGLAFQQAQAAQDAGSRAWLRRLHRSHADGPGPYSHCMHRPEAVTVSYTEIEVIGGKVRMGYLDGSPCAHSRTSSRLTLAACPPSTVPPRTLSAHVEAV